MQGYLTARVRAHPDYTVEVQVSEPCAITIPDRRWHTLSFYVGAPVPVDVANQVCSGKAELEPGGVQILPAAMHHRSAWARPTVAVHVHMNPAFILRRAGLGAANAELRAQLDARDPTLRALGAELFESAKHRGTESDLDALVDQVACHLAAHHLSLRPEAAELEAPSIGEASLHGLLVQLRGPSVASAEIGQLADQSGLSARRFRELFSARFGTSPKAYILRHRVEQSKLLMWEAGLPLGQIALEAGFYDQAHFSRTFRALIGMTPSQYARWLDRRSVTGRQAR